MPTPVTYYLAATDSDLTSAAQLNKKMLKTSPTTSGTVTLTGITAAEAAYFFSEPKTPGSAGNSGALSLKVNIKANTGSGGRNIRIFPTTRRYNSSGTPQGTSKDFSPITIGTATATHTFTMASNTHFGTWHVGDRLGIGLVATNLGTGTATIKYGVGSTNDKVDTTFVENTGAFMFMFMEK